MKITRAQKVTLSALEAIEELVDKGYLTNISGDDLRLSEKARKAIKGFEPTMDELKNAVDALILSGTISITQEQQTLH